MMLTKAHPEFETWHGEIIMVRGIPLVIQEELEKEVEVVEVEE